MNLVKEFKDEKISTVDHELKRYINVYETWEARFKAIEYRISDD